jgi:hypothetical protein
MALPIMPSYFEEDEMSESLIKRGRLPVAWALVALFGLLPLEGCDNPGTIAPIAGRRTADPVQKVSRGVDPSKVKDPSASPREPGKLPPGRGRAMD